MLKLTHAEEAHKEEEDEYEDDLPPMPAERWALVIC